MVLVSYDISDNKLRTKFSKDLSKYGFRLQYFLFQITNKGKKKTARKSQKRKTKR